MVQTQWREMVEGLSQQIGPGIAAPESSSAQRKLHSSSKGLKDITEEEQQTRRSFVVRAKKARANDTNISAGAHSSGCQKPHQRGRYISQMPA